jgi:hypothetical protein
MTGMRRPVSDCRSLSQWAFGQRVQNTGLAQLGTRWLPTRRASRHDRTTGPKGHIPPFGRLRLSHRGRRKQRR